MKRGWGIVRLGEIAAIERSTVAPDEIDAGTSYVGLEHIEAGGEKLSAVRVTDGELASSKFRFSERHILYGKLRPYLAKIASPNFSGVCSTDILPIRPAPNTDRGFLLHFLRQPSMVAYASARATGVNLPRLSPSVLEEFAVPLPPLEEQQRLAAILDQAEALRAKRRAALAKLDTLTQSIFLEMFGDPAANPKDWRIVPVSDYVAEFSGGRSMAADASDKAPTRNRVLKVSAVTSMEYDASESKPVPDEYTPAPDHFVRPGDLLFSRANTAALVGAVAYVHETPDNILLPDKLWRFVWRTPLKTHPHFVRALFGTDEVRRAIAQRATGTSGSMKNISQAKLLGIRTILPPLELQQQFARRVESVEKLKADQRASLAKMDELFASLQQRAFRGEL